VVEKRRFSRVPFRKLAAVRSTDGALEMEGEISNISLAGMLLDCDNRMPVGTEVDVEIILVDGNPELEITVKGKVVRISEAGTAVQFMLKGIPFESLTHLRYVVAYNLGDDDTVMDEYFEHIDANGPPSDMN